MGKNQARRSDETKKTILIAAEKLFSRKGYDAVTMREIAKEAAVPIQRFIYILKIRSHCFTSFPCRHYKNYSYIYNK